MQTIEKAKSFTPTEAMRNNAKRGLALREKYNRGGLSAQQANSEGVALEGGDVRVSLLG